MELAVDTLTAVVSDPASGCRVLVEDDGRVPMPTCLLQTGKWLPTYGSIIGLPHLRSQYGTTETQCRF